MRIGVDARSLSREVTGIGYYTVNIINELDKQGIETILFSPSSLSIDVSRLKNCRVVCKSYKNLIVRQIWSELYLPLILKKFNLDLFWGPSHRIPLRIPNGIAAVVTIHDLVWKKSPQTMRKRTLVLESLFMPRSLRKADLIISDTQSTSDDLQEFFIDTANKIRQISLAPRFSDMPKEQSKVEIPSESYILFVGTIEPRKNLKRLIAAYSQLQPRIKDTFNFIIVGGNGWGDENIENLIIDSGLKNNIKLTSYVSDSELIELYKGAYCLVMPSLYEGFGLPILEAQKFGVPVITSNISSMPEVVGEGGILVDPYSLESIRSGLERLMSDKKLRKKLAVKAKENVAKYSWDKTTKLTVDVFMEAIKLKIGFVDGTYD